MAEKEVFYEMLWDCAQCNTIGLLGETHRHCPTCGAAQDPGKRYFPKPGEELEAKDHQFVGADWRCAYCDSPNSATAAHCTNCGAGQDGTKPVAIVVDTAATAAAAPASQAEPAAPRSKRWLWALALLALVIVGLSILFTRTSETIASVSGRTWQREIQVEKFAAVSESAWCDSLPGDAYTVTQSREQRSTRRIEDGQVCRDERIDKGDGTFVKHRECTPRYREQAVYDNRCRFQVNRWRSYRSVKAGSEIAANPMWPSLGPMGGLNNGQSFGQSVGQGVGQDLGQPTQGSGMRNALGAEREGTRHENYVLSLQSGGKTWACGVPFDVWTKYQEGASLPIQVRMTGGVDCGSLK